MTTDRRRPGGIDISSLNWDKCLECGECLVNCRYLNLSREKAVDEIRKINRGEVEFSTVAENCASCGACNTFCPQGAHPYERIHYVWNTRYEKQGLPLRASYLLPTRRPNFRQDLKYSSRERALHRKWAGDDPPGRVCLYPGCNILTMPLLAEGALFEKLPVWGGWDRCCGEMYFRMGLVDVVAGEAAKLTAFYRNKPVDELVFLCPACYNMFADILPRQYRAVFHFKTTFFTDWFVERLERGIFKLKKKLTGSVVIHDSCHGRILGDDFMESQRRLLTSLGLTVEEAPGNRAGGLCCGMAAGCRRYSAVDVVKNGIRELISLNEAPGDRVAIYCTGCLLTFSTLRLVAPFSKKLVHLLELVREAMGETALPPHRKKSVQILSGIVRHALPHYFSRRRFYL